MSLLKKEFVKLILDWKPDLIAGIDARGFLFSSLIGEAMNIGTLMVRKSGKLPGEVIERSYDLEYGSNTLAMQKIDNLKGKKIVIMDDLLATGGTMKCAKDLIESQGALVCGCAVVVELSSLEGSEVLECPVINLASYED
jgi:adenine phosphoribosyltransferase